MAIARGGHDLSRCSQSSTNLKSDQVVALVRLAALSIGGDGSCPGSEYVEDAHDDDLTFVFKIKTEDEARNDIQDECQSS